MYLYFNKIQGSTLYAKYCKVNIGVLINSQNELPCLMLYSTI